MGKVIKLDERLLKERIDARGNENLQNQRIGNACIFVAQSGKTLYRGFFGESSFNSKRPPRRKYALSFGVYDQADYGGCGSNFKRARITAFGRFGGIISARVRRGAGG